jgi:cytochrome c5
LHLFTLWEAQFVTEGIIYGTLEHLRKGRHLVQKINKFSPFTFILALTLVLGVSSWVSPGAVVVQTPTSTAMPPKTPTPTEDSWIIVDLPPDASQLEYGTEVYRLVCKACHGDKGQGLTDDWRAQWAPQDQNCWQSKCHALNHPPDGFYLPASPAVVGPPLLIFETALDLYNYIHKYMPWHDRGSMTEKESWSVTAYILKINNIDPGPELNADTAAKILLRAKSAQPASPPPTVAASEQDETSNLQDKNVGSISPFWMIAIIATTALVLIGVFLLNRRSAK